jgi:hypothetical protein
MNERTYNYAEFLGYRWSSQTAFMAGLEVAGPQAVSNFLNFLNFRGIRNGGKFAGSPSLVLTVWPSYD